MGPSPWFSAWGRKGKEIKNPIPTPHSGSGPSSIIHGVYVRRPSATTPPVKVKSTTAGSTTSGAKAGAAGKAGPEVVATEPGGIPKASTISTAMSTNEPPENQESSSSGGGGGRRGSGGGGERGAGGGGEARDGGEEPAGVGIGFKELDELTNEIEKVLVLRKISNLEKRVEQLERISEDLKKDIPVGDETQVVGLGDPQNRSSFLVFEV